ncbi:MAG: adenylate/guanylate cyclase domain-containing protein [Stellaceae bacterium]
MKDNPASAKWTHEWALVPLVLLLLAGLPVAVWLDLRDISESALRQQAADLDSVISSVRGYYATNVVGRVLQHPDATQVAHNYRDIPGAIPIPATLSLELGQVVSQKQANIGYRFVSDFPFRDRPPHLLDKFEADSLAALRRDPNQELTDVTWSGLRGSMRLIAPVVMAPACVACHNTHPDSPKRDWKVGDVRGIQEITITSSMAANVFSFKYLLGYFIFTAALGFGFILLQRRQSRAITRINRELEGANEFLASIAMKISRYLSPQIYTSIFSGQKDVVIHTERKKLSIFFSDIKDFTTTAERLQPEEMTALLNEYFTEMSAIALKHGGTIDKFVGDAMLIFFGDPETKGTAEDARACVAMAIDMQRRAVELNIKWRKQGIEQPFRVRMGVNTGYCNVGNFGSADRMDYTIIGAEANLAARLQSIAEPGQIMLSYETYALVRDFVVAHALPPIAMKGISHDIVPYLVESTTDSEGRRVQVFSEHMTGLDFYLDPSIIDARGAARVRALLKEAVAALAEPGASSTPA